MKALSLQEESVTIEEWRDVVRFEGFYQVSNLGRVKRLAGTPRCVNDRIIKPRPSTNGYLMVYLSAEGVLKNCTIHRLVISAFLGESQDEVNHKDGNKHNNHIDNLEYMSDSENKLHAYRVLHRPKVTTGGAKGESSRTAKLNESEVRAIRKLYANGVSNAELSRQFNVSPSRITRIVKREQWKHLDD